MSRRFPGMDPFLEGQLWEDFHTEFITAIRANLAGTLMPGYVVKIENRVYIERAVDETVGVIRPDAYVAEGAPREVHVSRSARAPGQAGSTLPPVVLTLPMPEHVEEPLLTIRDRRSGEVITVIELLSPGNKRRGSDGRREYMEKREAVLRSGTHLVELDLLRGGVRLPTIEPLPAGDYYAYVARANRRPRVEVYAWRLPQPLPRIPVPLKGNDPDDTIDLDTALTAAFDRAHYGELIDYEGSVEPPMTSAEAEWVRQVLQAGGARG